MSRSASPVSPDGTSPATAPAHLNPGCPPGTPARKLDCPLTRPTDHPSRVVRLQGHLAKPSSGAQQCGSNRVRCAEVQQLLQLVEGSLNIAGIVERASVVHEASSRERLVDHRHQVVWIEGVSCPAAAARAITTLRASWSRSTRCSTSSTSASWSRWPRRRRARRSARATVLLDCRQPHCDQVLAEVALSPVRTGALAVKPTGLPGQPDLVDPRAWMVAVAAWPSIRSPCT